MPVQATTAEAPSPAAYSGRMMRTTIAADDTAPVATLKQRARDAATSGHWSEVLKLMDEGLKLDAWDFELHHWRAIALNGLERHDEAMAEARRATELKPDAPGPWVSLCWYGILAQRPAEARPACEKAVSLDNTSIAATTNVGSTYLLEGNRDEAWAWYTRVIPLIHNEQALRNGPLDDLKLFERRGWQAPLAQQAETWFRAQWAQRQASTAPH